ncbi:MAG: quinolinate synthase NadA [Mariprofundaceae bacterium]|nr:quinolinate synthase NadA [Mariprofundaceae bacterium]
MEAAKAGQKFAIATELNLVNRLRMLYPEKPIWFLSPMVCMCSTMFRTDLQHLYAALLAIQEGDASHQIIVPKAHKVWAKVALERMLNLA